MKYKVTFYCPDRHIQYDGGRLPDTRGVGGGVNARIRLSQTLAQRGHNVTMICNSIKDEVHLGVHYTPLDTEREITTDILILTTSGGDLDLKPFLKLRTTSKLKILLLHGIPKPIGTDEIRPDFYYPPSNFIRHIMLTEWNNVPKGKIFVTHRGVMKKNFESTDPYLSALPRDKYRLAYIGHPSKGRKPAIEVLKLLQKIDSRYHLFIFGDEQLWGSKAQAFKSIQGVKNFGLINQNELANELMQCRFGIFLQTRLEPYSNAMLESLSAGCIPIASPVGGYNEQIIPNWNGYFIDGHPDEPSTWKKTENLIGRLQGDEELINTIEKNARQSTYDWDVVARSWEEHWEVALNPAFPIPDHRYHQCHNCNNNTIEYSDGLHC
ncbi:MAG TPA: hypothetical protein DCX53_07600, partial [Anaerolineae bacterium]|nr:hypothetical protein [Anaerolineae bacterium]